jgi:hypothetical protein
MEHLVPVEMDHNRLMVRRLLVVVDVGFRLRRLTSGE